MRFYHFTTGRPLQRTDAECAPDDQGQAQRSWIGLFLFLLACNIACRRPSDEASGVVTASPGEMAKVSDTSPLAKQSDARFGQTIYVPVYSHIRVGDRGEPYRLAITMTFRNTDGTHPATILSARYFDDKGRLIKDFVRNPKIVEPMAALDFFVEESNVEGGSSASFLVEWVAEADLTAPIAEAVMIGTRNQQGVSFTSTGRVLTTRSRSNPGASQALESP